MRVRRWEDSLEDERGEATNPSNRLRLEDGAEGGLGEARTDGVRGVGGREGEREGEDRAGAFLRPPRLDSLRERREARKAAFEEGMPRAFPSTVLKKMR